MSSYSQTVTYNQFSSSSHPFDSFPPRYSYAVSPPPQPTYLLNPNSFRQEFTSRLSELTVNSRPIIQSLSTIAQDYSRYADVVVQCIEQHIRQVSHCDIWRPLRPISLFKVGSWACMHLVKIYTSSRRALFHRKGLCVYRAFFYSQVITTVAVDLI